MSIIDILLVVSITAAVLFAVRHIIREKRKGTACCGECSRCSGCSRT